MSSKCIDCISDASSTILDGVASQLISSDEEWEARTDDGFEDEVPMFPDDLSRIRTGDLSSLPVYTASCQSQDASGFSSAQAPESNMLHCPTFVQRWQHVMMPPQPFALVHVGGQFVSEPNLAMVGNAAVAQSIDQGALEISMLPGTQAVSAEDDESKDSAALLGGLHLCGTGSCRPCYDHIRGKCANAAACTYCHAPIHAIRRKQRKHQRRARAHMDMDAKDTEDICAASGQTCCESNQNTSCKLGAACQPCFRHIRGLCALGAACAYCHNPVHTTRHKQKKLSKSLVRASTRQDVSGRGSPQW